LSSLPDEIRLPQQELPIGNFINPCVSRDLNASFVGVNDRRGWQTVKTA
jgi:hypothetical protein